MTLAIDQPGTTARERRRSHAAREVRWHSWSFRLFLAGFVALIVSVWGGIVPFVGPTFGFTADGTGSWYWDLSHALLALIPGAAGCLVGITLMGYSAARRRTFVGLGFIGLLAVASGAWFAIGPLAWPVLYGTKAYFLNASPLRELAYVVGYALGPGLILAVVGGIAWGSETVAPGYGAEGSEEVDPAGVSAVRPVPVPEAAPAAATVTPTAPPATERPVEQQTAGPVDERETGPVESPDGAPPLQNEGGAAHDETTPPEYEGHDGGTMPE